MKIHIQKINIELNAEQLAYIEKKLNELERYIVNPNSETQAWVDIGRPSLHHKQGDVMKLTMDIRIPGRTFRVEKSGEEIFSLVNEVQDELQREIRKFKEKNRTQRIGGLRVLKRIKQLYWTRDAWRNDGKEE